MAEPVGPMTFRCPLAVRSTCPPARCTAATISLASLERQRFGVGCFFSAMPADLSIRRGTTHGPIVDSATPAHKPPRHRTAPQGATPSCNGAQATGILACDLVTVDPIWLRRLGVFIP